MGNCTVGSNPTPSAMVSPPEPAMSPTPSDLKGAIIYMDVFLGMTNQALPGDIISMRSQALKFRLMGKDYDYSGNYTVILNTPRQHRNPYFGFGSPERANILVLEDVGGQTFPLPNATIWEKEANFIDAVSCGKEWIYSGTYSIQK